MCTLYCIHQGHGRTPFGAEAFIECSAAGCTISELGELPAEAPENLETAQSALIALTAILRTLTRGLSGEPPLLPVNSDRPPEQLCRAPSSAD